MLALMLYFGLTSVAQNPPRSEVECGPKALFVAAIALGKEPGPMDDFIRSVGKPTADGYSLEQLRLAAIEHQLHAVAVNTTCEAVRNLTGTFVCIAHLSRGHFVLITQVDDNYVWMADCPLSPCPIPRESFEASWLGNALLVSREELDLTPRRRYWTAFVTALVAVVVAVWLFQRYMRGGLPWRAYR